MVGYALGFRLDLENSALTFLIGFPMVASPEHA